MTRKPISKQVETSILLSSRRRCCICFGLNRDTGLKSGQIAHLDHDNSNNAETNLAFLCLNHHDEYDSRPSQKKGMTITEVKAFKEELVTSLGSAFSQPVHFGELTTPSVDPYAGKYVRLGSSPDSAELLLTPLPDTYEGLALYYVSGTALWGAERPQGPNLGIVGELAVMHDPGVLELRHGNARDDETRITTIRFLEPGHISVNQNFHFGVYGNNVRFDGTYKRA
ncbi:hypothetical protein [Novosphingobium terrae]|uniref:hypothetical protein n=1 Tax=Novosphingobium terrae TaxID=2726189 RepID=UPI0019812BF0|nr:hypothetical protein [Novosphingobium terrae]